MNAKPRIQACLWFDGNAGEAAEFYLSVFPDGRRIGHIGEPGEPIAVTLELAGQRLVLLNGGPQFRFTEAISLMVMCANQDEVNYYWERLQDGGHEQQCGWLKDRYGLSWQVVPDGVAELLSGPDAAARERVRQALLPMKKLDIAALQRARDAG